MTTYDDILKSVDHCRTDLGLVADDLKWAMEPGLMPEGRSIGTPPGAALPERDIDDARTEDPDYIKGAKWALDIGDGELRSAFLKGVEFMHIAELRLTVAVAALETHASQPPVVSLSSASCFNMVDISRMTMERRLTIIERDLPMTTKPASRIVAGHLHGTDQRGEKPSARKALDLAVRKLSKAFARGSVDALWEPIPDRTIPLDKRCSICAIRRKHKKFSPRCRTCGRWRERHGGAERPSHLDGISPQEAASKRRARGEGWGIA